MSFNEEKIIRMLVYSHLGTKVFFSHRIEEINIGKRTILWTKGIPLDKTIDSSMPDIIIHDIHILTMLAPPRGVGVPTKMLIKFVI